MTQRTGLGGMFDREPLRMSGTQSLTASRAARGWETRPERWFLSTRTVPCPNRGQGGWPRTPRNDSEPGFCAVSCGSIRSNARACSHRRAGSGDAMSAEVDPQVVRAAKGMRGELGRCTPIWWRSCRVQTRLFVAFLRNWHRMRTLCGGALRTRRSRRWKVRPVFLQGAFGAIAADSLNCLSPWRCGRVVGCRCFRCLGAGCCRGGVAGRVFDSVATAFHWETQGC